MNALPPQRFPKLAAKAEQVHLAIQRVSRFTSVPISWTDDGSVARATTVVTSAGVRRPPLRRRKTWLEKVLLEDPRVYVSLLRHIELEAQQGPALARWSAWGMRVHPLEGLKPEVVQFVLGSFGPCYVTIRLGAPFDPFIGLLDNLRGAA